MQVQVKFGCLVAALVMTTSLTAPAADLVPFRAAGWKYVLGTQEASNPTDAWRALSFNDTAWTPASTPVGYPSGDAAGLEATLQTILPTSAAGAYTCVFLRKTFVVANPAEIVGLSLQVQYDDGYAAWLNGNSLGAGGVAAPFTIASLASDHEVTVGEGVLAPATSFLVPGTNVLAVQVFNSGSGSSDLFIDAQLTSAVDEPPVVASLEPPVNSILVSLTAINVLFNEDVSGVTASDLLINNNALATNVVVINARNYSFQFAEPPTGTVNVAWAPAHGIVDVDGVPQAFVPGPAWSYTLDPNAISDLPIISEFMADNENGIEDDDGTRSDWIEIYNPGLLDINLNGWYLTDTRFNPQFPGTITNLSKWRFPNVNLAPNKYLLVWASEKNRTNPAAALHTNFRLSKSAGYLALVSPGTNVVSAFDPYPAQETDNSYGRAAGQPNLTGYFAVPTPGAQNSTSGSGFVGEPTFSLESGVFTNNSLTLSITAPAGTTLRYTMNGSIPTNGSPAYAGPITFSTNMTIKVRAFPTSGTLWPGPVVARTFLFLDSTTRDFTSNLPILVMSTEGKTIPAGVVPGGQRPFGSFLVMDTFRGRASLQGKPDFHGLAQFEIFGQTSAGFPKRPYNIEINDVMGNDDAFSLLGMPAEADWKLRNPYSDKCLMNDFLAYELYEQMGHYQCRRRLVEVFVDTGGGKLSYPGDYHGVLVLLEKIEADKDRVDIAELTPAHTTEPSISGGYMFKRDKDSPGADLNFSTVRGTPLKIHEPKPREITTNQLAWLRSYLSNFETAMYATDWLTRTGTNHYSHYIDIDSFVDQHWIVEFPKQIDGYRISNFFKKDRNAKVFNTPIWDWNLSFGNADYLQGGLTNGWYYTQAGEGDHLFLRRMVGAGPLPSSGGDPDFVQKVIDRWGELRTNIFDGQRVVKRIDEIAGTLAEAAERDFAKFPRLYPARPDTSRPIGSVWPNPNGAAGGWHVDYVSPSNYSGIISEMKKWTMSRYLWVDGQFLRAPSFSLTPGEVAAGTSLSIINTAGGTVYYTTDGSDPRQARANGAVAPGALTYSSAITLNGNARVFARVRNGTVWSPPAIGTFVVQTPRLVITEIMYHPPPPGATNNDDYEYVELKNVGPGTLNLNGYAISGGIDFVFPNVNLVSGARILVVKNQAAFTARYGGGFNIAGQYTGSLANEGNRLILEGRFREPILDFSYDDDWYPITDGFGFSLVIVDETAAANTWGLSTSWRPSAVFNGTPGQGDGAAPNIPRVVINEAVTHSDPLPLIDTVELLNLSGGSANVGGWYLTDDFRDPKKYRIPLAMPAIPAGGFLSFDEDDFNPGGTGFSFSSSGDEVYLFSADAAGNLTGYYHGFQFGAQLNGVPFGRHVTSVGEEHFVALTSRTDNAPNAPLKIGPVVISEIMYRPQDVFANGAYWNNSEDEYIELRNITGSPVNLYNTTNRWKLDRAVEFVFPANTTIPANGYLVVVGFNPTTEPAQLAAFRAKYGIGAGVAVLGPYQGNLANGDENVSLYLPDAPETTGPDAGIVPYVLVDSVRYSDQAPWPVAADGYGHSLHRVNVSAYGDDPINWAAAGPTPGSGYVTGAAPTITGNPFPQTVLATGTASFTASATGPGPLRYQWRFNGEVISGATNNTLVLTNVRGDQAGQYQLFVLNAFGSVASSPATLTVLIPPNIAQQPLNQKVNLGASATFSVLATSINPPLGYQWYRDGVPIPGATSFSYSINNVSDSDEGTFHCALTDGAGTILSASATLKVLLAPIWVIPDPAAPLNLTAVEGETVTLSAQTRGTKPMLYRWRRISPSGSATIVTNEVRDANNAFLVLPNITSNSAAGTYTLILTNEVQTSPNIQRTNAFLTILADADGDRIPDVWENAYFNSATGAVGALDSDGDGMSNSAEYIAGTNPTNAASYLKVEGIEASGSSTITFQALANKTYTVEYKDGLDSLVWSRLADVVARNADWIATVNDPVLNTNRFYRLATPKRP